MISAAKTMGLTWMKGRRRGGGWPHLLMMWDCVMLVCLLKRRRGVHVARIDLLLRFHAGVHLRHAVLVGVGHVRLVPVRGLALLELTQALLQSIRTVDYSPG